MSCLCSKLKAGKFDQLGTAEIELLRQAKSQAPWIFSAPAPGIIEKLKNSYPNKDSKNLLKNDQLLGQSLLPDFNESNTNDVAARLFLIHRRLSHGEFLARVAKRIVCVALSELHPEGRAVDDLVSRVAGVVIDLDADKIRKKLYDILKIGKRWRNIAHLCAKRYLGETYTVDSDLDFSGVICLLGRGNDWEHVSQEVCEEAFKSMNADLFEDSKRFGPWVKEKVLCLKQEVSFSSHQWTGPPKRKNDEAPNVEKRHCYSETASGQRTRRSLSHPVVSQGSITGVQNARSSPLPFDRPSQASGLDADVTSSLGGTQEVQRLTFNRLNNTDAGAFDVASIAPSHSSVDPQRNMLLPASREQTSTPATAPNNESPRACQNDMIGNFFDDPLFSTDQAENIPSADCFLPFINDSDLEDTSFNL